MNPSKNRLSRATASAFAFLLFGAASVGCAADAFDANENALDDSSDQAAARAGTLPFATPREGTLQKLENHRVRLNAMETQSIPLTVRRPASFSISVRTSGVQIVGIRRLQPSLGEPRYVLLSAKRAGSGMLPTTWSVDLPTGDYVVDLRNSNRQSALGSIYARCAPLESDAVQAACSDAALISELVLQNRVDNSRLETSFVRGYSDGFYRYEAEDGNAEDILYGAVQLDASAMREVASANAAVAPNSPMHRLQVQSSDAQSSDIWGNMVPSMQLRVRDLRKTGYAFRTPAMRTVAVGDAAPTEIEFQAGAGQTVLAHMGLYFAASEASDFDGYPEAQEMNLEALQAAMEATEIQMPSLLEIDTATER